MLQATLSVLTKASASIEVDKLPGMSKESVDSRADGNPLQLLIVEWVHQKHVGVHAEAFEGFNINLLFAVVNLDDDPKPAQKLP